MVIQCGCLDIMRMEDGKLHSQLEWPNGVHNIWFSVYDSIIGLMQDSCRVTS